MNRDSTIRKPCCKAEFSERLNGVEAFGVAQLGYDFRNHTSSYCLTAFTDGKAHLLFHGDRSDELDLESHGVARHHHFHALLERHLAGDVGGADVELRLVTGEERR